jgi:RNA dependent RNA polymerase
MTSVFLVGPRGHGKSTLVAEYKQRHGETHVINVVWNGSPKGKAQKQDDEEQRHHNQILFISIGSIIDVLVDAMQRNQVRVPAYPPHLTDEEIHTMLSRLGLGAGDISELLRRYRESAHVLVHPFKEHSAGTNIEVDPCMLRYDQVFRLLRIPYIDLKESDVEARVAFLGKAILNYELPSPLASLGYYETLSSQPKGKGKGDKKSKEDLLKDFYSRIDLPFYRTSPVTRSKGNQKNDLEFRNAIKCLKIGEALLEQTIEKPQEGKTNRFLQARGGSSGLFLIHFQMRIPSATVFEILEGGIYIQGELYSFLGCSSSGLKDRKAFLLRGTDVDADRERQKYGDFRKLKSIAKKIARFSLLLSSVVPTSVTPTNLVKENDVESPSGSIFTDGCGCISPDLATKLYQETKGTLWRKSDRLFREPSVFQIRYQGIKGVVTRNSKLPEDSICVRPSMEKFETQCFPNICVCDFSRPFSYGHLNRQFIMLLSGLGIPDEIFEELQREHFHRVRKMLTDLDSALMLCEWRSMSRFFIEKDGLNTKDLRPIQKRLIEESPKLKILIPESRTLFGVAETPRFDGATGARIKGLLRPSECLVRITMKGGEKISLQNQMVVVSKNPAYLLGDVRVLRAVSSLEKPGLKVLESDLVDCIVFPVEGDRPHSEEIAGSDLDGDQYFVCWDHRLIPTSTVPPYHYPAYKNVKTRKPGSHSAELVRYFASQNQPSSLTGWVNGLFLAWADKEGVDSEQCTRLGQIFARVVDSAKSGERIKIEPGLVIPRESWSIPSAEAKFVWQRLEFAANYFVEEQLKVGNSETEAGTTHNESFEALFPESSHDKDFLFDLLGRNHLGMSEFTKFCLIMKNHEGEFFASTFASLVDFSSFNAEERGFAIQKYGVPAAVFQHPLRFFSRILRFRTKFFEKHLLEGHDPWKPYWRAESDESFVSIPSLIAHALRKNTDALMILQLPDSVVLLLRFSRDTMALEQRDKFLTQNDINGCSGQKLRGFLSVKAIFISGHFGYVEKYALEDKAYKMDLSQLTGLQLYREKIQNTFVHLKILQSHSKDCKEVEVPNLQVSIDLNRFNRRWLSGTRRHPLVRKSPVFDIELFVSNKTSDNSVRPARIGLLDILLSPGEPWAKATFEHDRLLQDKESEEEMMRHLQTKAEELLPALQSMDTLFEDPTVLEVFRSDVLAPTHQLFGVACKWPLELKQRIAAVSMELFSSAITQVTGTDKVEMLIDILAMLSDLDIDILWALPSPTRECVNEASSAVALFIKVVRRWDFWLALENAQKQNEVLQWLESFTPCGLDNARESYAFRNASEQARILLEELQDGSEELRSSTSLSRLSNLRMDRDPDSDKREGATRSKGKKKLPTVSMYCVQAMPIGVRFAIGEFVCITRQMVNDEIESKARTIQPSSWAKDFDKEFPALGVATDGSSRSGNADCSEMVAKRGGLCFGRVVAVCDAPFSVKVKLVAPSYAEEAGIPELITKCLETGAGIYWELSMVPANIVTHTRNTDAIRAFLESSSDQDFFVSSEILPYLIPGSTDTGADIAPFPKQGPSQSQDLAKLNCRQQEAVRQSLASRVSLVHGPPGTGEFAELDIAGSQIIVPHWCPPRFVSVCRKIHHCDSYHAGDFIKNRPSGPCVRRNQPCRGQSCPEAPS